MLKISVQSGNWYNESDPEGSFRFIRECGFDGIEYNIGKFFMQAQVKAGERSPFYDQSIEELLEYYKPVKAAADGNQIKICQTHAPFPLYLMGKDDFNEYLITMIDKTCAICQFLECPAIVVHPFIYSDKAVEKEINLEMYRRMIPSAKKYGVKLCLENLFANYKDHIIEGPCSDADEACWYIDTLNTLAGEVLFGYCLDIGHANLVGRNICEFIKRIGKRLTILHIHDNMGNKDSHLIPYTQDTPGGVDWDGFIEGLRQIGYKGTLSFETFRGIDALPEDVQADGLKLVSAIGRSFKRRIAEKKKEPVFEPPTPPL